MLARKLGAALALATALTGLSSPAFANEANADDFMRFFRMKSIDRNTDGMVSKKEFMAMMEKAYDMKAKAMGAAGGMMTERQMLDFLKSLYVGGN